jgi:hypothetical protein
VEPFHVTSRRSVTYVNLYVEVTKAINASLDLDEVFKLITEKIPDVIGVDAAPIDALVGR